MKTFLSLAILVMGISCSTPTTRTEDIIEIKKVFKMQEKAWSNHDLEGFMEGYLKSDSIAYFGSAGVTYGWARMLHHYKTSYPTKAETGTLTFVLKDIHEIAKDAYWVMGTYHLARLSGDAQGKFMVIFKRIDGKWKIVADSSC
ncbi:nuclear transport factor 2 family protein [Flavobacteriaceae bacterium F89]|uniref:Nuclear transport factor 2 family protein n=1 Tax=Cerina litoralis TaxID=2874477 RepID=A0AAE3JPG6_9FLAO|nr:nuclear transport factor 2 family protein [Cerina litoralis]MCG2460754.1 nuclear transport factor 2 family protein [Cerina litoralis]